MQQKSQQTSDIEDDVPCLCQSQRRLNVVPAFCQERPKAAKTCCRYWFLYNNNNKKHYWPIFTPI